MAARSAVRLKRPAHHGRFVRQEILDPLGPSITRAAEMLSVTRAQARERAGQIKVAPFRGAPPA